MSKFPLHQDIWKYIENFNSVAYNGKLSVVRVIDSINCREWENEKKKLPELFRIQGKKLPKHWEKSAKRCYVELIENDGENPKISNRQHHPYGHFDIRPISPTISDAFLPIPCKKKFFVTCGKSYKYDDYRTPSITTVPYTKPDTTMSLCGPASLWIILISLANEWGIEYQSLADIAYNLPYKKGNLGIRIADYVGLIKKLNLNYYYCYGQVRYKLLQNASKDFTSRNCCKKCNLKSEIQGFLSHEEEKHVQLMDSKVLYSYIESEIPVYLVFNIQDLHSLPSYPKSESNDDYHSVVAIGHTSNEQGNYDGFIIHDVDIAPFITLSREFIDDHLQEALVILPHDVLHFNVVDELLKKPLEKLMEIDERIRDSSKTRDIRPFLMSSQKIKFWFSNADFPKDIIRAISRSDFPKFVWVVEISNEEYKKNNSSLGYIMFNASVSEKKFDPIFIISPNFLLWSQNGKVIAERKETLYESLPVFRLV